ncbi:MAG: branched-chain amino acid transport system substrate-binding protein [Aliidongia sp.]|jgi:branched-chain amino acid transport system substrate-binding protein|nr:branched-chain amino acid transport system substrate-binding protein [Aliidongia sp.]
MLRRIMLMSAATLLLAGPVALAENAPGVTATAIKIGNTMPYSGPGSAYGAIGKADAAYFQMINDQGGVNGRKIDFVTLDDGYSPPKTVEQTRRLVEQDEVAFIFNGLGTPTSSAVQKYLNQKRVPQLFVATGASKWGDPAHFHWTMGWQPDYQTEARIYAKYILQNKPDAKISIIWQNDDFGKDYLIGMKAGLGDKYDKMVVKDVSYEVTDPTIDSQVVSLQASGADTLIIAATPKFAAQTIRKVFDIGWHPLQLLTNVSNSVGAVMTPAGPEKGIGIVSTAYDKDPKDPAWVNDPGMAEWRRFMAKYLPDADVTDANYVYGFGAARTVVQVLKQCGDDLSRDNIMKQAADLKDFALPTMLPGIKINTGPTDYYPIQTLQLQRWDGKNWVLFGDVLSGS